MKRIVILFIILLMSIGGCNDKETPTPEETNQETENYRIVKLGEDFPIKVGEKILIKDTLFVNDSTGCANDISPVYLNYLLTLDSIVDKRCLIDSECLRIFSITWVTAYFSISTGGQEIKLSLQNYHGFLAKVCSQTCSSNGYVNSFYQPIGQGIGLCLTLCYVEPHPDSLNPHPQQSEYTAYLVVNPVIK